MPHTSRELPQDPSRISPEPCRLCLPRAVVPSGRTSDPAGNPDDQPPTRFGGGGYPTNDVSTGQIEKHGVPNSGSGGVGCYGGPSIPLGDPHCPTPGSDLIECQTTLVRTCNVGYDNLAGAITAWGADGGSGIFIIVFDLVSLQGLKYHTKSTLMCQQSRGSEDYL
eukprot:scaffold39541_cov23-Cyclotella_meneghiniana.AAC.2